MKLLAVDVGNTSTAIGSWSGGRVMHVRHVDHAAEGADALAAADELVVRTRPDAIAYVSVVPKRDREWKRWAAARRLPLHAVTYHDLERVLKLDYPHPETIGADRLADAAGAVSRYGAPVLVMDFGTALTAAVVTADRVWRGGVIAPGFPLMRDYLFERTAKLPKMHIPLGTRTGKGPKVPKIGRSTEEAMRFGALVGYRGMVREIVHELEGNFGTQFTLVATGGFANWVLKDLELPFAVDPTLTLYGAGRLAELRLRPE